MSDNTHDDDPNPEAEAQALRDEIATGWKLATGPALEEIRRLVRKSELSQRKVEERVGFSKGYLSQLLARNLDLKLWHVLAILDALGLDLGEFFHRVYPATRFPALERFQRTSKPLSPELEEALSKLYKYGVESLDELRSRVGRCEQAVAKLEEMGYFDGRRRSRRTEGS